MKQAKLLILPLLAAGQLSVTTVPTVAHAQNYTVRCESQNNRRVECSVPDGAYVDLVRQLSLSPCVEGQSWGQYPRRGRIWVDQGCRAEFRIDRRGGRWDNNGRWGDNDRWDDNRFFRCESRNNSRELCAIPWGGRAEVRLGRQLSITPCVEGQTWGYAGRRQIWVDGGCRGEFAREWSGRGDGDRGGK
jgi:hypothetical protein